MARFEADGRLTSLSNGASEFVQQSDEPYAILETGPDKLLLSQPTALEEREGTLRVEYGLPPGVPLGVVLEYRLLPLDGEGTALETTVTVTPTTEGTFGADVAVRVPASVAIGEDTKLFAPLKNGVGRTSVGGPPHGFYVWELGGKARMFLGGYTDPLALPMVSESSEDGEWRLTWCSDPYFTTAFQVAPTSLQHPPRRELNWVYSGAVPLAGAETRRVYACLHQGDERDAIQAFYDSALAHIPAGPDWLHDIALIHYDYFSKAGRGWFEDIDAFSARIPEEDRHRVCVCLHGWYDRLGSYSMDPDRREIRDEWTLIRGHDLSDQSGATVSRDGVTEMLEYARSRGFRVALYYGDGLISAADWATATFPREAILRAQGWDEGASHSVILNPAHQAVRAWFLDYTRALMRSFGDHIDALVWDETYFFQIGEIGPANCPGYLDREFMTLMRDITRVTHEHRSNIAFLGSDNVGVTYTCDGTGRGAAAYSVVADGCWQDSACNPEAWPYGVFPNFRNVHWSCNWWPVRNYPATKYGAENFGTPAATSNGYGENRGLEEYPAGALETILGLFWAQVRQFPHRSEWLQEDDPRLPGPVGTHRLGEAGVQQLT